MRHFPLDDSLSQTLDDGSLPDAGFADENGVVFRPAREHLLKSLQLEIAPNEWIQFGLHSRVCKITGKFSEERRFFYPRNRRLFIQKGYDVFADTTEPHSLFHQDRCSYRAFFPQDPKQEMLGTNVVV